MQLSGTFLVEQWNETTETTFSDGRKLNQANIKQKYTGDINGTSTVHYHMYYVDETNSEFNGFEYLTCTIKEQECHLVFKHNGKFVGGVASSNFEIIQADGISQLEGKLGSFKAVVGETAEYKINN